MTTSRTTTPIRAWSPSRWTTLCASSAAPTPTPVPATRRGGANSDAVVGAAAVIVFKRYDLCPLLAPPLESRGWCPNPDYWHLWLGVFLVAGYFASWTATARYGVSHVTEVTYGGTYWKFSSPMPFVVRKEGYDGELRYYFWCYTLVVKLYDAKFEVERDTERWLEEVERSQRY